MPEHILSFYDALAGHYHLIFEDWEGAIARQAGILGPLLASRSSGAPLKILDCACGIGTQSLGFAALGHRVTASDLSPAAVDRARCEAALRGYEIAFHVADMTSLLEIPEENFDVVAAMDNALPHLTAPQLGAALRAIHSKVAPGGIFLASIRDYDGLIVERPDAQPPAFYGAAENRRIVHQVWDWKDGSTYTLHLYLTVRDGDGWRTHHFVSEYRPLLREELSTALRSAGFAEVDWLMPEESGYYQPLVIARR